MEFQNDLHDFTFIIPVRIDSTERKENLELVISYLKKHFATNIMVLEADTVEKVQLPAEVHKIFIEDEDPVFHHSRYRNLMIKKTTTDYIALWDADAIAPPEQVMSACELLRNGLTDLVFPYDGKYFQTLPIFKNLYRETMNMEVLIYNAGKMRLMHGVNSVGGAIMMKRMIYCDAGMENEKFYGWSPEDYERIIRCEILGYKIVRINGPLFHLYHQRGMNSWFFSNETNLKARKELLKVCRMNPHELRSYINSNDWLAKKFA